MKVLGIDNVFVPVSDFARAVEFYRDVLGFPVAKQFDELSMALLQVGDETPGLGIGLSTTRGDSARKIWFEVPDARAAADELSAKGVQKLRPPFQIPTGWVFEIEDSWGNVLGFTDYLGKPELGRAAGNG